MRIYPATLMNLALCHDWTSVQALAEQRGIAANGAQVGITTLLKAGYVERREVRTETKIGCGWRYEYKISAAGQLVLYPPNKRKIKAQRTAENAAARASEKDRFGWLKPTYRISQSATNPWENLRYTVAQKPAKWTAQFDDDVVNKRGQEKISKNVVRSA